VGHFAEGDPLPQVVDPLLEKLFPNVAVNGVWTALLIGNIRTTPAIAWAVLAMAIILSLLWQYLNGRWASAKTSEFFIAAVAALIA
jgi:uncharacterized membrane protein YfbV (UPF0208 family)